MKIMKMKRTNFTREMLLWILAAGGLVAISLIAPQLPAVFLRSYLRYRSRLERKFLLLEQRKWIRVRQKGNTFEVRLTKEGRIQTAKYQLENLKIPKPKKWDGKWRIVAFDIPKEKKLAREVLRRKLYDLDFQQMQKSVYVHPYECREQIEVIKTAYHIWPYVFLLTATEVEREEQLKTKFHLH